MEEEDLREMDVGPIAQRRILESLRGNQPLNTPPSDDAKPALQALMGLLRPRQCQAHQAQPNSGETQFAFPS